MWINVKCKYIKRDGKSVKVARGDEIPEAEFWPDRDRLERTRFIRKIPDVEKTQIASLQKVTDKPKRKRGRPKKVVVEEPKVEEPKVEEPKVEEPKVEEE